MRRSICRTALQWLPAALFVFVPSLVSYGAPIAWDNASELAYADGWQNGDNGGQNAGGSSTVTAIRSMSIAEGQTFSIDIDGANLFNPVNTGGGTILRL